MSFLLKYLRKYVLSFSFTDESKEIFFIQKFQIICLTLCIFLDYSNDATIHFIKIFS